MIAPERSQLTVRITKELNRKIAKAAKKLGISKNAFVQLILSQALEQKAEKQAETKVG